jgi:hypothetical protein
LVDADGEAVDYAGRVAPFDIRVAAAEWRIILSRLLRCGVEPWRQTRQLMVRGVHRSFCVVLLPEGYALVAELLPRCFRVSPRALSEPCARSAKMRASEKRARPLHSGCAWR